MKDLRPDPRKKMHPEVWQMYLWYMEHRKIRITHEQRISAIERGKSNLSAHAEREMLERLNVYEYEAICQKLMVEESRKVGPIFEWLISIKGIADHTASKLIALIDHPARFDTISKLWRYSGYGTYWYWVDTKGNAVAPRDGWQWKKSTKKSVIYCRYCGVQVVLKGKLFSCPECNFEIEVDQRYPVWTVTKPKAEWVLQDGLIDRRIQGWHSPFVSQFKSEIWLVTDSFVKQRTPLYREQYDKEKAYQRRKHPEKLKINGRTMYNDGHLHARAKRKVGKLFMAHLWLKWRGYEGLPVSDPYVAQMGGHNRIIPPSMSPYDLELAARVEQSLEHVAMYSDAEMVPV